MKYLLILMLLTSISYAQIEEGAVIKASDIQEIKDKVERKKKCVRKNLSTTVSSSQFLNEMEIGGLSPNTNYEVTFEAYFNSISATQHELYVYKDDSSISNPSSHSSTDPVFIAKLRFYNNNSSVQNHIEFGKQADFTTGPLEDTVKLYFSKNSGTNGNLQASGTSVRVCESDDEENVSSF